MGSHLPESLHQPVEPEQARIVPLQEGVLGDSPCVRDTLPNPLESEQPILVPLQAEVLEGIPFFKQCAFAQQSSCATCCACT